jgi:dipeptidyl aminopeptidase/acylaminoacyl peptidase
MRSRIVACCLISVLALPARGQGVPDSIVAEGVPPIPAELSRALNRYQNTRTASFHGWLGDRREMLVETRFADTPQVHHVAFPGGARAQLTFQRERVLAAAPRPGRDQFAFTTDEGGAENYQVLFADLKTGEVNRLTDGKSRNVLGGWSHGGGLIAWSGNGRNGKDLDLYVADPSDPGSTRRVKEVAGSWTVADWSPDDRRLAVIEYVSIEETYVHLVDVADGRTETLTPRAAKGGPTVAYSDVKWSKDGRALYWTTDQGSEFRRLVRYDLATQASTPLSAAVPWDVEGFDLSDDGRTLVFVANEGGLAKLHVLDVATNQERPAPPLAAGQVGGLRFRRGSQEFGFTFASARAPADAYSFDAASNRLERWTKSETGGLNPDTFAEPSLVEFASFDGRKVPAFVYRPNPSRFPGRRPVLVDIHGGPEGQFRPGFQGRLNYLTDVLGVTVIHPNVRGSAGYGKSYLRLDNGVRREDSVKDIGALLDWVARQPDLDPARVAVIGGSYGGYMSLATQVLYGDRLKAGIDVVGISNFVTFLKNTQSYRRDLRRAEYGDERDEAMRAHLERISPLTNAARIKVPLLIVQGKNDPRVPLSEAEQMLAAVRKNGRPVWYILGKDEGHGFAKKTNQDYLQAAEVVFLERFLLDKPE